MGVYRFRTDPNLRDTDGDGVDGYAGILLRLNPLDPTDGTKLSSLAIPLFR